MMSVSEARLNELARVAYAQHERFTLTRNGTPEAVLFSVDDLEGREISLEVLADSASVGHIPASLAERASGASRRCRRPWPESNQVIMLALSMVVVAASPARLGSVRWLSGR